MKFSLAILSVLSTAIAAYVPTEPWSTLTPSGTVASCAVTEYSTSFGIAIATITSEVNIKAKRDLISQIPDGQIQHTTETFPDTTITVKETIFISKHGSSVSAIPGNHPDVIITQIGDGQIQVPNPTPVVAPTEVEVTKDGKKTTSTSYYPISTTSSFSYRSVSSASSSAKPSASTCPTGPAVNKSTCKTGNDLAITLENGVLKDSKNRIGSIVSNRQFQFDGPVPQAGAIYAAGWGIVDGHLTLGGDDIFWECLSGTFYNLYDESIGEQCIPVHLNVVDLVDC